MLLRTVAAHDRDNGEGIVVKAMTSSSSAEPEGLGEACRSFVSRAKSLPPLSHIRVDFSPGKGLFLLQVLCMETAAWAVFLSEMPA